MNKVKSALVSDDLITHELGHCQNNRFPCTGCQAACVGTDLIQSVLSVVCLSVCTSVSKL